MRWSLVGTVLAATILFGVGTTASAARAETLLPWHGLVILTVDQPSSGAADQEIVHFTNRYAITTTFGNTFAALTSAYLERSIHPSIVPCATVEAFTTGSVTDIAPDVGIDVQPTVDAQFAFHFDADPENLPVTTSFTVNPPCLPSVGSSTVIDNGVVDGVVDSVDGTTINTVITDNLTSQFVAVDGFEALPPLGTGTAKIELSRHFDTDGDGCPDDSELVVTHTDIFNPSDCGALQKPDFTPPPSDLTATAPPGTASSPVTYPLPTASDRNGPVPVVCQPPSGSTMLLGNTPVLCTASNTAGTTSATFTITLKPQPYSCTRQIKVVTNGFKAPPYVTPCWKWISLGRTPYYSGKSANCLVDTNQNDVWFYDKKVTAGSRG